MKNFYKIGTFVLIAVLIGGFSYLLLDEESGKVLTGFATLIGILAILLLIYFLPALVAHSEKHHNATAIFVLNLLLGWTFIGWVIALVWAVTKK